MEGREEKGGTLRFFFNVADKAVSITRVQEGLMKKVHQAVNSKPSYVLFNSRTRTYYATSCEEGLVLRFVSKARQPETE